MEWHWRKTLTYALLKAYPCALLALHWITCRSELPLLHVLQTSSIFSCRLPFTSWYRGAKLLAVNIQTQYKRVYAMYFIWDYIAKLVYSDSALIPVFLLIPHTSFSTAAVSASKLSHLNSSVTSTLPLTNRRCFHRMSLQFRTSYHVVILFLLVILHPTLIHQISACTLNIRSILHPIHSAALSDLVDLHKPQLFCLCETWIKSSIASTTFSPKLIFAVFG